MCHHPQNVPPDLSQCVFVIEQALSVRALQELVTASASETVRPWLFIIFFFKWNPMIYGMSRLLLNSVRRKTWQPRDDIFARWCLDRCMGGGLRVKKKCVLFVSADLHSQRKREKRNAALLLSLQAEGPAVSIVDQLLWNKKKMYSRVC